MSAKLALPVALAAMITFSGCIAAGYEHDGYDPEPAHEPETYEATHDSSDYEDTYERAFEDADLRWTNDIEGSERMERTIPIPLGTDSLRVAIRYEVSGDFDLRLENPLYRTQASESVHGSKTLDEESWFTIEDPLPLNWYLDLRVDGCAKYAIGIYLED